MNLINMLPPVYEQNQTMKELQNILSKETNSLATKLNETIDQCFVETSTNLLSRYERIYGLEIDVSKSNEFRRERIKAKIRGQGTTTKEMIRDVASSYSNGEVEIVEDFNNYRFIVRFIGEKGIPANMSDLILTIEEIKPAHLEATYEFTYNTWNMISGLTWDEASTSTWESLRVR